MKLTANRAGRRWFLPAAALGLLALLAAAASPEARGVPPRGHVVEIRGMAFQPEVLEVERGDTVTWVNRDIVPHTATALSKPAWSTGVLAKDESGRHVAGAAGEYAYFCELHPGMRGTLKVR